MEISEELKRDLISQVTDKICRTFTVNEKTVVSFGELLNHVLTKYGKIAVLEYQAKQGRERTSLELHPGFIPDNPLGRLYFGDEYANTMCQVSCTADVDPFGNREEVRIPHVRKGNQNKVETEMTTGDTLEDGQMIAIDPATGNMAVRNREEPKPFCETIKNKK